MSLTEEKEIKSSDLPALLNNLPIIFTVRNKRKDDEPVSYFKTLKVDEEFEEAEKDDNMSDFVDDYVK